VGRAIWSIFTARRYAKRAICGRRVSFRVSVCVSVTLRYCIKTAKRRIMQIMPHDRSATLVYTDKHIVQSVCHSRATCYYSANVRNPTAVLKITNCKNGGTHEKLTHNSLNFNVNSQNLVTDITVVSNSKTDL